MNIKEYKFIIEKNKIIEIKIKEEPLCPIGPNSVLNSLCKVSKIEFQKI